MKHTKFTLLISICAILVLSSCTKENIQSPSPKNVVSENTASGSKTSSEQEKNYQHITILKSRLVFYGIFDLLYEIQNIKDISRASITWRNGTKSNVYNIKMNDPYRLFDDISISMENNMLDIGDNAYVLSIFWKDGRVLETREHRIHFDKSECHIIYKNPVWEVDNYDVEHRWLANTIRKISIYVPSNLCIGGSREFLDDGKGLTLKLQNGIEIYMIDKLGWNVWYAWIIDENREEIKHGPLFTVYQEASLNWGYTVYKNLWANKKPIDYIIKAGLDTLSFTIDLNTANEAEYKKRFDIAYSFLNQIRKYGFDKMNQEQIDSMAAVPMPATPAHSAPTFTKEDLIPEMDRHYEE